MNLDICVLGAGISGLSFAHRYLALRPEAKLRLLEKESRPGGLIRTSRERDTLQEWGPETVIDDGSGLSGLVADLGLESRILDSRPEARVRWLALGDRLEPLPTGPGAFLRTPLLSLGAKLGLFLEPFRRRGTDPEESFASFIERRFGRQVLERFADPFASGIYACVPERMEMASCFPKLFRAEREFGSVIRGLRKVGWKPGRIKSFPGGVEECVEALRTSLGDRLRLGWEATRIARTQDGTFEVTPAGEPSRPIRARRLVCALPSRAAAPLLEDLSPELARELRSIDFVSVVSVHMAFPMARVPGHLRGFGYLIPRREARDRVLGVLFSSCIFEERARPGTMLFRTLLGGARNPVSPDEPDEAFGREALESFRRLTGVGGEPLFLEVRRRPHCLPVYEPGHRERLRRIDEACSGIPGLHLCGLSYRGSSVALCVENARRLAAELAKAPLLLLFALIPFLLPALSGCANRPEAPIAEAAPEGPRKQGGRIFRVGSAGTYRTISAALADMRDGDVCRISEGVYRERLVVRQDGVTLVGEGKVVITGYDEAGTMRSILVNGRRGLSAAVEGPVYEVFQGKRYLIPARHPNKTAPMTSNRDWADTFIDAKGRIRFLTGAPPRREELRDGFYVGLHSRGKKLSSWYSLSLPVTRVGRDGAVRVDAKRASSGFLGRHGQGRGIGYILGAKAALDAPGEWYTDGKRVLLIPPRGGEGPYEFRTRLYGAVITGRGVKLKNLRFTAAAARVVGDEVAFESCVFEYISPFRHNENDSPRNARGQSLASGWGIPDNGTAGVFVEGDAFTAVDCRFSKSWWSAMTLRGNGARIRNCLFEDVNWIAKRCAALFSWGKGNVVRFCTFRNLGAAAIEGGNANWIEQYATKNLWEHNLIENACTLVVDQGFFYVNQQAGDNPRGDSIWRYNLGIGGRGPEKGNWKRIVAAFYVDNSSSGYRIHNNIAIDVAEAFRFNDTKDGPKAGKDIWCVNNTFIRCGPPAYGFWMRGKPDAEVMLVNNAAVGCEPGFFSKWAAKLGWKNNVVVPSLSALKNPDGLDFTPVDDRLKHGGLPVLGRRVPYLGAVDPTRGMWRFGADESRLPSP